MLIKIFYSLIIYYLKLFLGIFKHKSQFLLNHFNAKKLKNINTNIYTDKILDYKIKNNNLILLEILIDDPIYVIKNCIIGNYFRHVCGMNVVILLKEENKKITSIINQFDFKNIVYYEKNYSDFFEIYRILKKCFKNVRTIKQFLNIKYNRISIGKLIYDDYIRLNKIKTCSDVNIKLIIKTINFIKYYIFLKKITKKFNFKYLIIDETQFYPSSIVFHFFLSKNKKVFVKYGSLEYVGFRYYDKISQAFENKFKFSKKDLESIFKIKSSKKRGEKILLDRINGNAHHKDIKDSFHFKKKQNLNKDIFYKKQKWSRNKKVGLILCNNLYDGLYGNKWRLFNDNVSWLVEILNIINKQKKYYWIIKPHPSDKNIYKYDAKFYFDKIIDKKNKNIVFAGKHLQNFKFENITDACFTIYGSAGLEYPFKKIPTVLSGDSFYSHLNLCSVATSKSDLKKYLNNFELIKKINQNEYNKLCKFIYLYIDICKYKFNWPFQKELTVQNYNEKIFFKKIQNYNFNKFYSKKTIEKIKMLVKDKTQHTIFN